ncbi:hypothetical protein M758_2G227000 [Ceratodon purpureus]|nr:hypothetical protein M758_2G227000 [Ceratodon purpureus]
MAEAMATSLVKNWRLVSSMDCAGFKAIVLGQIISLLMTCTGWSSSILSRNGIHAPLTQSFLMYFLYTIVYGSILIYRRQPIQIPWYWYLLLASVDVESNYLGLMAYRYTSITSAMLLVCWSIPCVLFLTWRFLRTRYSIIHFFGVALCVSGLVTVILSDVHSEDRTTSSSNVLLGDTLVVAAAVLFACMNVSEEFVVKNADQVEYLALIGFFGMIVSGCQLAALESKELVAIDWNTNNTTSFMAFALSSLAFSSLVPVLLRMSGATMLNLSLLTADMWALAVQALGFHEAVDGLYFVALALVAVGLLLYASAGEPSHAPEDSFLESAPELKYTLIDPSEKNSAV